MTWLSAVFLLYLIPIIKTFEIAPDARVDCLPGPNDVTKENCLSHGCIWDSYKEPLKPTIPFCYYPKDSGYLVKNSAASVIRLARSKIGAQSPYGQSLEYLDVTYKKIRQSTLKVTIGTSDRYVPPVPLNENLNNDKSSDTQESLSFEYSSLPVFSFTIKRSSDPAIKIWDTSIGGLVFADQFIQIATYLPSDRIYGFGENVHQRLKHSFSSYKTWAMFSIDEITDSVNENTKNYYGVHPFYMGIEPNTGKAHGVFIFNSNAQEVTTGPAPHLIYRTIGGQLDIYFFAGPTPEDVIRQYLELIGRPHLPSYWGLGYQFCRYGYKSVDEISQTINRIQQSKIPFDVVYADIDYMERYKDFTLGENENWNSFSDYAKQLHSKNLKLVLIVDPAIAVNYDTFKRAISMNASFIEWADQKLVPKDVQNLYPLTKNTKVMLGIVWPYEHVTFPDFLDTTDKTQKWWTNEFMEFHKKLEYDGIWIDMNEPSNFATNKENVQYPEGHSKLAALKCPTTSPYSKYENPPYATHSAFFRENFISQQTMCMSGVSGQGSYHHYDVHSLYGWSETVATRKALETVLNKRSLLFSRSTFPSSGAYGGHWLGDNSANWQDLRNSIIAIQEFNLFGIPYTGSDVCGFVGDTNEELCLRWQQLGAFYPFFRNHNDINKTLQDPPQWRSVAEATRVSNLYRYQHLPYLYSLLFRASIFGGTVFRPVFFEFPQDVIAQDISHQFMWGPSMLIIPVIYPNADFVHGYLPYGETWYSASLAYNYGSVVPCGSSDFDAPRNTPLPTFVRGGSIIPRQRPGLNTVETRLNEFQILVAPTSPNQDGVQTAKGELYWDDGESILQDLAIYDYIHLEYSIKMSKEETVLRINCTNGCGDQSVINLPSLDTIEIFSCFQEPDWLSFKLNNNDVKIDFKGSQYYKAKVILKINGENLIDLNNNGPLWVLSWKNQLNRDGRSCEGGEESKGGGDGGKGGEGGGKGGDGGGEGGDSGDKSGDKTEDVSGSSTLRPSFLFLLVPFFYFLNF